jgi:hypothetical protein
MEIRGITLQGQSREKVWETPFQSMTECNGMYLSLQLHGKVKIGGSWSRSAQEIKQDSVSKITMQKELAEWLKW